MEHIGISALASREMRRAGGTDDWQVLHQKALAQL